MAEETTGATAVPQRQKTSTAMLAMGFLMVASLGAAGWFWQRSTLERAAADTRTVRSVIHLESFVVNLSGASENGYLRVGIDLGVGTEQKESEKQTASIGRLRDTILTVLGTRTVDDLLTPAGKAKLKEDMLVAINEHVPEIQCREIYFNEFLVQR